jgi:hypothetical protein
MLAPLWSSYQGHLDAADLQETPHEVVDVHPYPTISELTPIDDDSKRCCPFLARGG